MIYLIIKRLKIKNTEQEESFLISYGTFFDEFKNEGASSWLFYVLFVARRVIFAASVILITSPVLQLALAITMCVSVINIQVSIYLIATNCFIDPIMQLYIILNEFLTAIFYFIILLPFVSNVSFTSLQLASMSIQLILVAIILNTILNSIVAIASVIRWYRKRKSAKVLPGNDFMTTTETNLKNNHLKTMDI